MDRLSDELCRRGHQVVVVAPSDSRELVKEGRARVEAQQRDSDALFAEAGSASLVAVGQSLPFRRGGSVALPLDVSRTLEDLLEHTELDFVHVHKPFAPSAASAALRHSRALNVGSFHGATQRLLDPGGPPGGGAALRPPGRPQRELHRDPRADGALLPR